MDSLYQLFGRFFVVFSSRDYNSRAAKIKIFPALILHSPDLKKDAILHQFAHFVGVLLEGLQAIFPTFMITTVKSNGSRP